MTPIQTFRSQFWFTFRYMFNLGVFGALAVILIEDGPNLNWTAFRVATAAAAIVGLILTWLFILYFTISIFEEGLHGYDFWARYHTVAWNSMIKARTRNLAGLRYVCVDFDDGTRTLWIPKFLRDSDRFCELVREYAGDSNPLYRELVA